MRFLPFLLALAFAGRVMAQQGSGEGGGGAGGGGGGGMKKPSPVQHNCVITHGTVMGLAFAFLMPLGAIMIRVASFRGLLWVHAVIQAFAYVLAWVGLGLGIYIAVYPESQIRASNGHPIIGIIVVGALLVQAPLALLHHAIYKKNHKRTIWATIHVWWGRIIVTLAIINGGLGLMLSGNTTKGEIAYGVVAGFMWLTWVGVTIFSYLRTRGTVAETGMKISKDEVPDDTSPDRD